MLTVTSVNAYPFLAFSDLTCPLKDTGISGHTVPPDSKETKLKVATKRLLHQQVKIQGSFSAMFVHGKASLQLFPVVWIFLRPVGVICYGR